MRYFPAFLIFFVLILTTSQTFAQESTPSAKPNPELRERRVAAKEKQEEIKKDLERRQEQLKQQVEAKREEIKTQVAAKREALKERLEIVKDEKKKMTAENLDERLAMINKNQTDNMLSAIEKLSDFLQKITTLSANIPSDQDTQTLEEAISAAEEDLAAAEEAVTIQAGKEYVATITTETRLRQSFSTVVTQLKTDLKTTQESVKTARDSVKEAAGELAKFRSRLETPIATQSAQ